MSIEAIRWAYQQEAGKAGPKFLLVTLADYANAEGECWPSVERLAADTEADRKSVLRWLAHLESLGLITTTHRGGAGTGRQTNRYIIAFDAPVKSCEAAQEEAREELSTTLSPKNGTLQGLSDNLTLAKSQFDPSKVPNLGHKQTTEHLNPITPPAPPTRKTATPARAIDPDFRPDDASTKWIKSFGVTVDEAAPVITEFTAYWTRAKKRRADWQLAFRRNSVVSTGLMRIADHKQRRSNYANGFGIPRRRTGADIMLDACAGAWDPSYNPDPNAPI